MKQACPDVPASDFSDKNEDKEGDNLTEDASKLGAKTSRENVKSNLDGEVLPMREKAVTLQLTL